MRFVKFNIVPAETALRSDCSFEWERLPVDSLEAWALVLKLDYLLYQSFVTFQGKHSQEFLFLT